VFYLIYGKNRNKSTNKAISLVNGLVAKKPDASYIKVDEETFGEYFFEEVAGGQGLFENKSIVLSDNLWSLDLPSDEDIEKIQKSENIFILIENGLSLDALKQLKSKAEKVIDVGDEQKKEIFNIFSLSDAYSEKDKKKLWLLYRKSVEGFVEAEDVINIIFWQIKNLILAKKNLTSGALKLSPFVISKAKAYSTKWEEKDLIKHSEELVKMIHNSRLGKVDLEVVFEKWILDM